MRWLAWLLIPLCLAACGGSKSAGNITVTCGGNIALSGVPSVDVMGDTANGRPVMTFRDPVNPGKSGTLTVQPHDYCRIGLTPRE